MLLSGGVDSSVALRLLARDGHDVTAYYLKIWLEDELSYLGDCPWEEDLHYASSVCAAAGVPLEVIALQREYKERVVSWTLSELHAGRTPSPRRAVQPTHQIRSFLGRSGVAARSTGWPRGITPGFAGARTASSSF